MTSPQNQAEQLSGSSLAYVGREATPTQRGRALLCSAMGELLVAPQQGSGDENERELPGKDKLCEV